MRINPKLFTLSTILVTLLATSPLVAAQGKSQDRGPLEPNLIERIIRVIKRHLPSSTGDEVHIPPPAAPTAPVAP